MDDFFKDVELTIKERLSNPLLFAFMLSFLVINYKLILFLFSGYSPEIIIDKINTVVWPDDESFWRNAVELPLYSSLFYVFLFSWVSVGVSLFTAFKNSVHVKLKIKIEKDTPLSAEEAEKLRTEIVDLRVSLKKSSEQLDELMAQYQSKVKIIEDLQANIVSQSENNMESEDESKRLSRVKQALGNPYIDINTDAQFLKSIDMTKVDGVNSKLHKITVEKFLSMNEDFRKSILDNFSEGKLYSICDSILELYSKEKFTFETIKRTLKLNDYESEVVVAAMIKNGLLSQMSGVRRGVKDPHSYFSLSREAKQQILNINKSIE